MKTFVLISLALIALANASHPDWELFKAQYGKSYVGSEEIVRQKIFLENIEKIYAHNALFAQGKKTYTVAVNQFADMHPHEFHRARKGYLFNPRKLNMNKTLSASSISGLPLSVDWRKQGIVTNVKDQGQCGSCWAFSAIASLESQHALITKNLIALSEQNLVDCSQAEGNNGCGGGLMDQAFEYIQENNGVDTESSYPYEAVDQTCKFKRRSVGATLKSWVDLPSGDELALQKAVATIGPISIAIDASS